MTAMKNANENPILIPKDSLLEGFIKTKKSFRIESDFYGTLLSTEKVIIDESSNVEGDIVCSELLISGNFKGNIFCTGKTSTIGSARIEGQVFTKLFQNESNCDLNCFIQIPNNDVIAEIQKILESVDSKTKLSTDKKLKEIVDIFVNNVYTAKGESKKPKVDNPNDKDKDKKDFTKVAAF